jgi:hypothetical protein
MHESCPVGVKILTGHLKFKLLSAYRQRHLHLKTSISANSQQFRPNFIILFSLGALILVIAKRQCESLF